MKYCHFSGEESKGKTPFAKLKKDSLQSLIGTLFNFMPQKSPPSCDEMRLTVLSMFCNLDKY